MFRKCHLPLHRSVRGEPLAFGVSYIRRDDEVLKARDVFLKADARCAEIGSNEGNVGSACAMCWP